MKDVVKKNTYSILLFLMYHLFAQLELCISETNLNEKCYNNKSRSRNNIIC